MINFREMQNRFILGEGYAPPDMNSYIQALEEALGAMSPASLKDHRRLSVAKENLRNIRRHSRKVQAEFQELQERVVKLEETATKKRR